MSEKIQLIGGSARASEERLAWVDSLVAIQRTRDESFERVSSSFLLDWLTGTAMHTPGRLGSVAV